MPLPRLGRWAWFVFAPLPVVALLNCLADPREGDVVNVISDCDVGTLSSDPKNPQSSVKAYVDSAESLARAAQETEGQLKDACNAIGGELGLAPGNDPITACQGISARIEDVIKRAPAVPPGTPKLPDWVEIRFTPSCNVPPGTKEQCLAGCAGPCDTAKCDPASLIGKCNGTCKGRCSRQGTDVACNGSCLGQVEPIDGGTCVGECIGRCQNNAYTGNCYGGCGAGFTGKCGGTCTGTCDGVPINTPGDGGMEGGPGDGGGEGGSDAGDDGGDGGVEAGPGDGGAEGGGGDGGGPGPGGPPPVVIPNNAPGNCGGICVGLCSFEANGDCKGACTPLDGGAPPPGPFYSGGQCSGVCFGVCRSGTGSGSVTQCDGVCTEPGDAAPTCEGICRGGCEGTIANGICEGRLNCEQNNECNNACEAKAAASTVCVEPGTIELFAASDPALYAAITKHAGKLGLAVNRIKALRTGLGFIAGRTASDFAAIGANGDLVRACVKRGNTGFENADKSIRALITADPTRRKYQQ